MNGSLDVSTRELAARRTLFRRNRPNLLEWSASYRFEGGEHLDFDAWPFQREIYTAFGDASLQSVDVMKSAQAGISAAGVSLALYAGDVWGANVLYVFPTADDVYDFSDTRIKPSIEASAYLRGRVSSTDNKGLKRIGDAFIYFRGSMSESKALSVPCDLLIFDEYDRLDKSNIPKFRKRLNAATSMNLERRFSNPSHAEDGVHAEYLKSDQREWLIRCPKCRLEAPITWDRGTGHFLDENREARACGRCGQVLEADTIGAGRWVASRPGVAQRGYHVSRLIVPNERIGELIANHAKTDESSRQAFYNFDMGLPYSPAGGSLSRSEVLACRRDYTPPDAYAGRAWVTAGVDVGSALHVRITRWMKDGKAAPLYIGEVGEFEDVARLFDRYGVNFALVDERPEERKARDLANAYRGRVMLIRWAGDEQRDQLVIDRERSLVVARRTAACDRLIAQFSSQARLLPRDLDKAYLSQLTAPYAVTETNRRGQRIRRYVSERADHFFFAEVHDMLAKEVRGTGLASGRIEPAPIRRGPPPRA